MKLSEALIFSSLDLVAAATEAGTPGIYSGMKKTDAGTATSAAVQPDPPTKKPRSESGGSVKGTALKDPKGGLTAAGRKAFAKKDGSHLRPGVKGAADTPEKMKRKGSFLTRHFTHPSGPMVKDEEPTRLALSAQAWGEPVPKTEAAAARLAAKGRKLLEQYQRTKEK